MEIIRSLFVDFFASSPIIMFLVPIILILVVVLALFKKTNNNESVIVASTVQEEAKTPPEITLHEESVPETPQVGPGITSTETLKNNEMSTVVEPLPTVQPIIQEGTITEEVLDPAPMKQESSL